MCYNIEYKSMKENKLSKTIENNNNIFDEIATLEVKSKIDYDIYDLIRKTKGGKLIFSESFFALFWCQLDYVKEQLPILSSIYKLYKNY